MSRSLVTLALAMAVASPAAAGTATGLANPVMFVTQVPIHADFATIGSTFANHLPFMGRVGRGGDLYILYPDGELRNLTQEAGFGIAGVDQEGPNAIAVRDPAVHWSGTKAVFSMVRGAPAAQFQVIETYWQLYEVTNLDQDDPPAVITPVPNQPEDYNNVSPVYASDGRILFTSDRPRGGERHLWPQHDEYESTPTVSGLWSLDPATGELFVMSHSPSGVFTPEVDSFGRVVFTRWDHLQRDQQADADAENGQGTYGTFDFADESASAAKTVNKVEVFPEPRADVGIFVGHRFNHFFPWQINQDGTEEETLAHIGRHELHSFFERNRTDDPEVEEFIAAISGRVNQTSILNFFQITEDPTSPGRYLGVEAPEFDTHAGGQIVAIEAPPGIDADLIEVEEITHADTATVDDTPPLSHTGHYRDPLMTADGQLLAVHAPQTGGVGDHAFRIKKLVPGAGASNGFQVAGPTLTGGIVRNLEWWSPDVRVTFNGTMWELTPVEVVARAVPPAPTTPLGAPEAQVFAEMGVDPAEFQADLAAKGLALLVSRNVTARDDLDEQQPYNLRVPGGVESAVGDGEVYPVRYLQLFQGDQVRGIGGVADPNPGRRVLARHLHDPAVDNPPAGPTAPEASVAIAPDGSVAAMVPAHRAMTWQLTDPQGEPVVRERYWITFQPGEVRVCAACHGVNDTDQLGRPAPDNPPEALRTLLQHWGGLFDDGFESGDVEAWSGALGD